MKIKLALIAFMAMFVFVGCGDDDEKKAKFSNEPTALEANDDSGQGIYKAVIVGSTGSIVFNMDNKGDGKISAVLVLDGKTYKLHTEDVFSENGYFEGYFYGTMEEEDDIEIYFEVDSDGSDPYIEFYVPDHDITYRVYKELSTHVVMVYEGTYSVLGQAGAMNIVATMDADGEGDFYGVAGLNDTEVIYYLNGGISVEESVKILTGGGDNFIIAGTISGNNISGTCNKGEGQGTWSAKRTL